MPRPTAYPIARCAGIAAELCLRIRTAFSPFLELFDISAGRDYLPSRISSLQRSRPTAGADAAGAGWRRGGPPRFSGPSLIEILRAPAPASRTSRSALSSFASAGASRSQVLYACWDPGPDQGGEKPVFLPASQVPIYSSRPGGRSGAVTPTAVYPRLVLIAKNAYVWLEPLARIGGRSPRSTSSREELDHRRAGIPVLWCRPMERARLQTTQADDGQL